MAKKRKYYIKEEEAIPLLESYGFSVKIMNFYQYRIRHPEYPDAIWDWYHTQGSVVMTENRIPARFGTTGDAENLAESINSFVYDKI